MINKTMTALRVKVKALAQTLGTSQVTIYSVLNGRTPREKMAKRIGEALKLSEAVTLLAYKEQVALDRPVTQAKVKPADSFILKPYEKAVITAYRKCSQKEKEAVRLFLMLASKAHV